MAHFLPHAVALLAAAAALADAGLRVARHLGAAGAEAAVAAAAVAATAAALSSLGLGLIGLGGSPLALLAVSTIVWGAAARLLPRAPWSLPRPAPTAAAAVGVGAAWTAWVGRHPALGIDPLTYHLSESVIWAQEGSPGSVEQVVYDFEVGAYPLVNEILVSWLVSLGRSFAPSLLWTPLTGALFALAGWALLRRLGAGRAAAALAVGAVLLVPIAASQHIGPHTDLPALAWLAATGALAAAGLAAPAVLAAGLAVGTKTTVAPLVVLALAVLLARRGAWRHGWSAVAAAAAAAAVTGGLSYVRNWIEHGSPLWPFAGGDARPELFTKIDVSFLSRPGFTLEGRVGSYFDVLAAAPLVIAVALLAWLLARRRLIAAGSAATAVSALLWASAPFTGRADDPVLDFSLNTTRYLFPTIALAAGVLALARHRAATAVLAAATLVGLAKTIDLPYPFAPGPGVLVLGALAGVVLTILPARAVAGAAVAGALLFLLLAGPDLPRRHARTLPVASSPLVAWLAERPDAWPVAGAPQVISALAGDDLRRELRFIAADEPCAAVRRRLAEGWVVVGTLPFADRRVPFTAGGCVRDLRPAYRDRFWAAYTTRR